MVFSLENRVNLAGAFGGESSTAVADGTRQQPVARY